MAQLFDDPDATGTKVVGGRLMTLLRVRHWMPLLAAALTSCAVEPHPRAFEELAYGMPMEEAIVRLDAAVEPHLRVFGEADSRWDVLVAKLRHPHPQYMLAFENGQLAAVELAESPHSEGTTPQTQSGPASYADVDAWEESVRAARLPLEWQQLKLLEEPLLAQGSSVRTQVFMTFLASVVGIPAIPIFLAIERATYTLHPLEGRDDSYARLCTSWWNSTKRPTPDELLRDMREEATDAHPLEHRPSAAGTQVHTIWLKIREKRGERVTFVEDSGEVLWIGFRASGR
ncbi:MAG: hypothetical protein AAGG01_22095 [Planctomycetota bacterium]